MRTKWFGSYLHQTDNSRYSRICQYERLQYSLTRDSFKKSFPAFGRIDCTPARLGWWREYKHPNLCAFRRVPRQLSKMLDNFSIFARGGIILFNWSAVTLKGGPIDALIQTVLLEERSGQQSVPYTSGTTKYTLKWTFNNDLGIVLVAVCDTPCMMLVSFTHRLYACLLLSLFRTLGVLCRAPHSDGYRSAFDLDCDGISS
jgi:hypothetical protein